MMEHTEPAQALPSQTLPPQALSITRTTNAYHGVRGPAERLADRLLSECRDVEAQAVLNLLKSHHGQRCSLTDYHNRLQLALAKLGRAA